MDQSQRGLPCAASRLDKKRKPPRFAYIAQKSVQAVDIVATNGAVRRVPVGNQTFSEPGFYFSENALRALKQNRRLFERCFGESCCVVSAGHGRRVYYKNSSLGTLLQGHSYLQSAISLVRPLQSIHCPMSYATPL